MWVGGWMGGWGGMGEGDLRRDLALFKVRAIAVVD